MRQLSSTPQWHEGEGTHCRLRERLPMAGGASFERACLAEGATEHLTSEFQRYELVLDQVTAGFKGGEC